MHQGLLFKKLLPYVPKRNWLNSINHISSNSIRCKDNNCVEQVSPTNESVKGSSEYPHNEEDVSKLLDEAATFEDANNKDWTTSPYPKDVPINHKQQTKPQVNPENTSVILFPGQGTIKVGMVKQYMEFPAAKELFEIANEITDFNLLKLCLSGPQEKLNRTEFNQAATVVTSLAALEKIRAQSPKVFETCVATAGYSVGEISSLILSGILTFEDGIRLVWARGKAMQKAADSSPQGMLSIFCTREAKVSEACTAAERWAMDMGIQTPICRVAIYLHTQRKILAGNAEALSYVEKHKTEYGLADVTKLPVSGAFHTPLMEPALKMVFETLSSMNIHEPRCKVYSNYKAVPYSNLRFAKKYILKQIVSPVRWEQCLQGIYNRPEGTPFPQTYDVGSGGRMKAILKLINAKACRTCTAI